MKVKTLGPCHGAKRERDHLPIEDNYICPTTMLPPCFVDRFPFTYEFVVMSKSDLSLSLSLSNSTSKSYDSSNEITYKSIDHTFVGVTFLPVPLNMGATTPKQNCFW